MSQLTLTIPDAVTQRVLDALCAKFNYTGTETKAQFVKALLIKYVMDNVIAHEAAVAAQAAAAASAASIQSDIVIT